MPSVIRPFDARRRVSSQSKYSIRKPPAIDTTFDAKQNPDDTTLDKLNISEIPAPKDRSFLNDSSFSVPYRSISGVTNMSSLKPVPPKIGMGFMSAFITRVENKHTNTSIQQMVGLDQIKRVHLERLYSMEKRTNFISQEEEISKQIPSKFYGQKKMAETLVEDKPILKKRKLSSVKRKSTYTEGEKSVLRDLQRPRSQWENLDQYIEMLLECNDEQLNEFIYLNPGKVENPYDLHIAENYSKRNVKHYYTISGKGVTLFKNDKALEFNTLNDWLIERDLYGKVKNIPFFKNFRKWKFIKMWKRRIVHRNRKENADMLEDKLFILDDVSREHILKHRDLMIKMEKLRFTDKETDQDTLTLEDFAAKQETKRLNIVSKIKKISKKAHENFTEAIEKILSKLRNRFIAERNQEEEEAQKTKAPKKEEDIKNAKATSFESIRFPENLNYGQRASLRKECGKFLRLAYLYDFIALDALRNIYIESVRELISRMQQLDQ